MQKPKEAAQAAERELTTQKKKEVVANAVAAKAAADKECAAK